MSVDSETGPPSLQQLKEDLEIQKLRAEIEQIARPAWKTTTFWIAAVSLGIAVPGTFIQWATNTLRFERAELQSQQELKDVRDELGQTRQKIVQERERATIELETARAEARKISRPALDMIEALGGFNAKINFDISENDFYMIGLCHDEHSQPIGCTVELLDAHNNLLEVVESKPDFGGIFVMRIPERAKDREKYDISLRLSAEGKRAKHQPLFATSPYLYRADFEPAR
jgi:hypothetical protein